MDDSHTGVFVRLVAIVSVLLLKIHALESMDVDRWRALLVAPSSGVGRWCYCLSLQGSQSGTGFEFNRSFANQAFSHLHVADFAFSSGDLSRKRYLHDGLGRGLHDGEQKLF